MVKKGFGTPATVALSAAGIGYTEHVYSHDTRHSSFGMEAADALGLDPDEVFKTLMAVVDGSPVIGLVPVSGSLDLKALAAAMGGRHADMADAALAQRLTGYVVGGISPVGQKRLLPTLVDASAEARQVIYVSGGRRGFDIGLAPADLLAITGGTYAAIARAPRP